MAYTKATFDSAWSLNFTVVKPMKRSKLMLILLVSALTMTLYGCKGGGDEAGMGDAPAPTAPYIEADEQTITVEDVYPGRVVAIREAQVRPQVSGIVRARLFTEGDVVEKGDALYQIDPDVFAANVAASKAAVSKANAALTLAKQDYERAKELREGGISSSSELDSAKANYELAKADLAAAKAQLRTNNLNLSYAKVEAPLTGRISISKITEGALVSPQDPEPMTIIQQIDEVYVDVKEPLKRYEELQQMLATGALQPSDDVEVPILSVSGAEYPIKGEYLFTDTAVDSTTSEVTIRIKVDNPEMSLRPGMLVRARVPQGTLEGAVTVPQQAVKHDATLGAYVYVIDDEDTVERRAVRYGRVIEGNYVITEGLKKGERVVTEGHSKLRPGAEVTPEKWSASKGGEEDAPAAPPEEEEPADAEQDDSADSETANAADAEQP